MGPEDWDNPDWDIGCWDDEPDIDADVEGESPIDILNEEDDYAGF